MRASSAAIYNSAMDKTDLLALAQPHYPPSQRKLLEQAIDRAASAHSGQKRASGEAYITHPLAVAAILIEWKLDLDSVIAGVLHDALEETELTRAQIEGEFGPDVVFLVEGVSKVSQARAGRGRDDYRPQTQDNLSKFLIALAQDIRVLLIKLADRLHNLRTLEHLSAARQQKIAKESLQVFAPLADRLGMGRVKVEIEDIAFRYLQPKDHRSLSALLKKRLGRRHQGLEEMRRTVAAELAVSGINFSISGRIKSVYSLYKKLQKDDIEQIYDLLALRLIVEDKDDCYRVLGVIHRLYQPLVKKIKDYIAVPKANGYQSLHTTVITPNQQIVEFQIRTEAMHEFAERGLAASFHYNEQKISNNYLKRRSTELPRSMLWILELQELAQQLQAGNVPEHGLHHDLFSDRIFVYTPKGDIFDLPSGATVLDFAYAVHSDIGQHAQGARIHGKIARLSAPLSNGDVVEVLTRSTIKPSTDWLKSVKTAKARQRIKAFLNKA